MVALGAAGLALLTLTALLAAQPAPPEPWRVPAPAADPVAAHGADPVTGVTDDLPSIAPGDVAPVSDVAATLPTIAADVPRPSAEWVEKTAELTAIPPAAVRAYGAAALRLEREDPACRLAWTTLAGVGAIESGHGTHGGAVLGADGRPSVPVVGPALDGDGVAAIAATPESTAMHGDPRWDHAVGPMQFLPSSWLRWGADGDGDGLVDPHDLDDAALAAGRYLCVGERDLGLGEDWHAAVHSYNHSDEYVADVLARADRYAELSVG